MVNTITKGTIVGGEARIEEAEALVTDLRPEMATKHLMFQKCQKKKITSNSLVNLWVKQNHNQRQ